jgi:hypothetical protein
MTVLKTARTDTEQAARAITGRPILRLLARGQFHRTLIWAGPSSLRERSNGPLSRDTHGRV